MTLETSRMDLGNTEDSICSLEKWVNGIKKKSHFHKHMKPECLGWTQVPHLPAPNSVTSTKAQALSFWEYDSKVQTAWMMLRVSQVGGQTGERGSQSLFPGASLTLLVRVTRTASSLQPGSVSGSHGYGCCLIGRGSRCLPVLR